MAFPAPHGFFLICFLYFFYRYARASACNQLCFEALNWLLRLRWQHNAFAIEPHHLSLKSKVSIASSQVTTSLTGVIYLVFTGHFLRSSWIFRKNKEPYSPPYFSIHCAWLYSNAVLPSPWKPLPLTLFQACLSVRLSSYRRSWPHKNSVTLRKMSFPTSISGISSRSGSSPGLCKRSCSANKSCTSIFQDNRRESPCCWEASKEVGQKPGKVYRPVNHGLPGGLCT